MTLSPTWIGIDVSKAWLDIASSGGEGVQRIANTMDAIAAFAATLAALWETGGPREFVAGERHAELFVDLENS